MVEYDLTLDQAFGSLADATRRDIISRVARQELTVSQIAAKYQHLSLAAVSKHLKVLQAAQLIYKRRQGKHYLVSANSQALFDVTAYLQQYEQLWQQRLDRLDSLLNSQLNSGKE